MEAKKEQFQENLTKQKDSEKQWISIQKSVLGKYDEKIITLESIIELKLQVKKAETHIDNSTKLSSTIHSRIENLNQELTLCSEYILKGKNKSITEQAHLKLVEFLDLVD